LQIDQYSKKFNIYILEVALGLSLVDCKS